LHPDGDVTLAVTGTAFAGAPFAGKVEAGTCVRIMTGGVVPAGADTIVMQEHVRAKGDAVTIGAGHRKGQNLRRAGEDLAVGQVALKRGLVLRPADVGLLASL
jgi:molybdopterin molybdotransferase